MKSTDDNKPKFQLSIGGLTITSDEMPYFIMGSPVKETDAISKVRIDIADSVKTYPKMYYTTDISALGFILRKLTLRSSNLSYYSLIKTFNNPFPARDAVDNFWSQGML